MLLSGGMQASSSCCRTRHHPETQCSVRMESACIAAPPAQCCTAAHV